MAKILIGEYEGSIYPDGNGYRGAIDLGFDAKGKRQRVKRRGKTKAQVKDKLREAVADLEAGVTTDAKYSVEHALNDFLAKGLKGRAKGTIGNYRSLADHNVIPQIGGIKLKELTADHLDDWLDERAEELSARALRLIHSIVERAIRQAQARDKVRRNVASLVDVPEGQEGRPSKAMTLNQAVMLLQTVEAGHIGSRPMWCCPCCPESAPRKRGPKITKAARLGGEWSPRELRHSFVSILSAHDVRLEDISDLVGHSSTSVTETVYRHEIRPALTKGATAMDRILEANAKKLA